MSNRRHFPVGLSVRLTVLGGIFYSVAGSGESAVSVNPAGIPRIGTVEERFPLRFWRSIPTGMLLNRSIFPAHRSAIP